MPALEVNEYIQVAHRLTLMPGKCQQIHGHSMRVFLKLYVEYGPDGYAYKPYDQNKEMIDYGVIKEAFRKHLNDNYDHRLLLNEADPWAQPVFMVNVDEPGIEGTEAKLVQHEKQKFLPGLRTCPGDPTTENLSKWIAEWAHYEFDMDGEVRIEETTTNAVACGI